MKESIYVCNIEQIDGLYQFINTDTSKLKGRYNITNHSEDNLNSIYDIVMNIIDEEPDNLLIYINKNTIQLVSAIIMKLLSEGFENIIIFSNELHECGVVSISNYNIKAINNIDILLDIEILKLLKEPIEISHLIDLSNDGQYSDTYITRMQNGIEMYLTGNYYDGNYITNAKHIEIEQNVEIQNEKISSELLNINSAFIYNTKKSSSNFYNNIKKDLERPVYSHIHQLEDSYIKFDKHDLNYEIRRIKYSDYNHNDGKMIYLEITDSDDLEAFIKDLEFFMETGKLAKNNYKLINTCTWSNHLCGLSKLTRFKLDKDFNIKPCLNSEVSTGKITDDYFENIKSASKIINKTRIKRNCIECKANNYCSKCSLLPDNLSEDIFCETMRKYPIIPEFVHRSMLVSTMIRSNDVFNNDGLPQLEISNFNRPLVFDGLNKKSDYKINNILTAFKLNTHFYIIGYKNPKLFQTDERFLYIAESFVRNISLEDLTSLYSNKYSFGTEESIKHIHEAYKVIKEAKIV